MNDLLDLCLEVVPRLCQLLGNRYIDAWFQRTTNRKWHMGYQMVTWPMTYVTWPWKVKLVNPIRLECHISKTAGEFGERLRSKGPPIGNDIWRIKWSRDRWLHVTPKVLWGSTAGYPSDSLTSCFLPARC